MEHKDAYIEHLENTIAGLKETISGLQNQISNLTEMIMLLRKEKFGSSSEKTSYQVEGRISLFNEVEIEADASATEPVTKDVRGYKRTDARTRREELIKDLPVREVLCETPDDELYCLTCLSDLKPVGKEVVREDWNIFLQRFRSSVMSVWHMNARNVSIQIIHILKRL